MMSDPLHDPVIVRTVIVALVALSSWLWPRDMRRNWATWTRRARRLTMAIMPVLAANGYALVIAASYGVPVRSSTLALFVSFVILNVALLYRPTNDHSTDRQYEFFMRRFTR
jgi:cellobiose-specific phosphotransferase system component IIC